MPKTEFSAALVEKQKSLKLTIAGLAKAIGVSVVSATAALRGKSVPNASTIKKYAKFLRLEVAAAQALTGKVGPAKAVAPAMAATKATKPAPAKATKLAKKAKLASAAKPAKAKMTKSQPVVDIDISDLTLGEIAAVFADPLLAAVAKASPETRKILERVLAI